MCETNTSFNLLGSLIRAQDLFTKTFNPSLLQKENSMHSERRAQASKLLSAVARKMNNPRLATLAVRVRLDAFTRVKKGS